MNKFTVFALVCVFMLGACAPTPASLFPTPDTAGTVDSIAGTAQAQTLTAQPSSTITPIQDTATPQVTEASATSAPSTSTNTNTPEPNLTTTPSTATSGPVNVKATATFVPSATPTAVLAANGSPTLTPTLTVLTYGTLPPANTPYTQITLINAAKREAYISLQVVTAQGYTIIEHPVKGAIKVKIPVGYYTYVAWVGGRQFIGNFNVLQGDEPTIRLYPDKIEVIN